MNQKNVERIKYAMVLFLMLAGFSQAISAPVKAIWPELYSSESSIGKKLPLLLPNGDSINAIINFEKIFGSELVMFGVIEGKANSLFEAHWKEEKLEGKILFTSTQEVYLISQDENEALYLTSQSTDSEFCKNDVEAPSPSLLSSIKVAGGEVAVPAGVNVRALQSNPGAKGVIYLHLSGTTIPANSYWSNSYNSKQAFSVAATAISDQSIYNVWSTLAEDFAPFQLNITTDSNVYNAKAVGDRFRVIVTPTSDKFAALSTTGIAPINGYQYDLDAFCFPSGFSWETDGYMLAEVCSHEVGHAVGLSHDGNASTGYYRGHGSSTERSRLWGPIMGATYNVQVSQWSKGEYTGANQTQDDLAIISGNNFGYRVDDHGDTVTSATSLSADGTGTIIGNNVGIIERNTDVDVFSFTTTGGSVSFQFSPIEYKPNLKIKAELLDNGGNVVVQHTRTDGFLDASLSTTLTAGTYYLRIDGVGHLTVNTGYSDYGSIGQYSVTGSYPVNGGLSSSSSNPSSSSVSSSSNTSSSSLSSSQQVSSSSVVLSSSSNVSCIVWETNLCSWNGSSWDCNGPVAGTDGNAYSCKSGSEAFCNSYSPENNAWSQWDLSGVCNTGVSSSSQVSSSSIVLSSSSVSSSSSVTSSSSNASSSSSSIIVSSSVTSSSSSGVLSSSDNLSSSSDVTTSIQNELVRKGNILHFDNGSNLEIDVYSLQGHRQKITLERYGDFIQLNLNQLNAGLWVVRAKEAGKVRLHKVLLP